jgi:hypothetical protein
VTKKEWPFESGTALKFTATGIRVIPKIVTKESLKETIDPIWSVSFSSDNLPTDEPATDETSEDKR